MCCTASRFVTVINYANKSAGTFREVRLTKLTPTDYGSPLEEDVFKTKSTLHEKELEGHRPPQGDINGTR